MPGPQSYRRRVCLQTLMARRCMHATARGGKPEDACEAARCEASNDCVLPDTRGADTPRHGRDRGARGLKLPLLQLKQRSNTTIEHSQSDGIPSMQCSVLVVHSSKIESAPAVW